MFAVVTIAAGLGGMTQTALNTLASDVLDSLGVGIGWGQWLATAYIFSMGAAVPLASFLTKRFSLRGLVLAALTLYFAGSLCDFLAINFAMLLIGRVLEAVGTGILMPLLQTIAMTRFPENRHGTAMGIAGIALGFAPNIGPTIGGALSNAFGWRSLFLILVISSALLLVVTVLFVRERTVANPSARLDVLSLVLSTLGFGGLLVGFTSAANIALSDPLVWTPVAVGAVCLVFFLKRQLRLDEPLVNLRIFRSRAYCVSYAAQMGLYGCFLPMTLIIPLFVVDACGYTTLEAGLVLLPGAIAALVFEPGAGAASDRLGPRRVAIFGGVFLVVGAALIAMLPETAPLWVVALSQTLRCVGLTTLIPTTTAWGLHELRAHGTTTDGSSFLIMSRQIFAALCAALMVLLITTFSPELAAGTASATASALGYHLALWLSTALGAVPLFASIFLIRDEC
ncbi:MAG: MFS transporter [Coriobacteriales bacterium]